jgi:ketosteroid isomerase-like protein
MSTNTSTSMTVVRLQAFDAAWNVRDVDLIMSFMANDCAYHASSGPDALGTTYRGHDEVRAAIAAFLNRFPDAHFAEKAAGVAGDRGFTEWTFSGTAPDGHRVVYEGCDLYTFRGDLITVKNAFRKA